jgi:hypothetical protein
VPLLPAGPGRRRRGVRLLGGHPDRRQAGEGRVRRVRRRVHAEEQAQDRPPVDKVSGPRVNVMITIFSDYF